MGCSKEYFRTALYFASCPRITIFRPNNGRFIDIDRVKLWKQRNKMLVMIPRPDKMILARVQIREMHISKMGDDIQVLTVMSDKSRRT